MNFEYSFIEKLDLTCFCKQAYAYIGKIRDISYKIFIPNFRINATIEVDDCNNKLHHVVIAISELELDKTGLIVKEHIIYPLFDKRFKQIKNVFDSFDTGYQSVFTSDDVNKTITIISSIITTVHKVNRMKAFI